MNDSLSSLLSFLNALPPAKKASIAVTALLVLLGFAAMFIMTNQIDYKVLFNDLSQQDASQIVTKLTERNIPYRIEGNGSLVLVPADKVRDLRLSFAGDGLPKEGHVGFEIFDKTDFGATRFVQELNYRRALQGELARTISRFKEVDSARVFVVLPKASLFLERQKPATAAIQLDLRSNLPPSKLAAIVHLTASAVEGLEPERVTVVDTKGRVIFQGGSKDDGSALLSNIQLDYKAKLESGISRKIQTMLEGIVGSGKAIVRVVAEINFTKITQSEEEYDPSSTVVRSSRQLEESSQVGGDSAGAASAANQRSGVIPSGSGAKNSKKMKDIQTNYEINRITRSIIQPAGNITRLSVAAVIDGIYQVTTLEDGTVDKQYIPRSNEELLRFETIVKGAMGYSEDREDQISVTSFPFSASVAVVPATDSSGGTPGIVSLLADYQGRIINLVLVGLVFMIIVRPLLKSLKGVATQTGVDVKQLPAGSTGEYAQITGGQPADKRDRAFEISRSNPEKTDNLLKGWMGE